MPMSMSWKEAVMELWAPLHCKKCGLVMGRLLCRLDAVDINEVMCLECFEKADRSGKL
jgi:hypothetical protein